MGLMNGRDYRQSLNDGRRVWIDGERVPDVTRHPAFQPMISAVERIYEMQHEDRFRALLTFDGRSRFYKPPASRGDLVMRRHMTLAILDEVSPVMDRFGDETVTALFVMADRKAVLERYDRRYGAAVDYWLDRLQRSNEFMTSGNTDLKGDRSKQPYQQPDPDSYLRVVAERDDGIVIRGAKYETGASYAHVAFVKPTVGQWLPENRDYAVGCVVSLSDPRVRHICRPPLAREPDPFELPLTARWDEIDTLLVFDDVLVPWENVFFSRQPELANVLRADLTWWAAQGFLLRSLAKADLMVGTALLVAEQTRSIVIPEVKQHIAKLMGFRETLNAFILASEAAAEETETGLWKPNQSIQNAGRVYASTTYNPMVQILRDLAGGSPIIVPGRRSMENPEISADIEKYFRVGEVSAESRIRVLNLVRELTATGYAGRTQAYQMFAETPAFAQAMSLYATFDRDSAMKRAARLAGL